LSSKPAQPQGNEVADPPGNLRGGPAGTPAMTIVADPRPGTRAFIAEHLEFVLRYGDIARSCAEMGDDTCLEYSVRKLVEYTKVVANSTSEIIRDNKNFASEQRGRAA
jgi:hypothetical protein